MSSARSQRKDLKDCLNYTREAGVRNLERQVAAICRGVAVGIVDGKWKPKSGPDEVTELLGPEVHIPEAAERTELPGIATGMLNRRRRRHSSIGATKMPEIGKLRLTGSLGDVMKELWNSPSPTCAPTVLSSASSLRYSKSAIFTFTFLRVPLQGWT